MRTRVTNVAELRAALVHSGHITIDGDLEFHSPADCIDVAAIRDPAVASQMLTIEGNGPGYRGSVFYRMWDNANTPLLRFPHNGNGRAWDWELRLKGLCFDARNLAGTSLDIEYQQLSRWEDMDFRNHISKPYIVRDGVSGNRFVNIGHFYNKEDGELHNITDFVFEGGNAHSDWAGRNGGVSIKGRVHNPPPGGNDIGGPGWIHDFHNEGCRVTIDGIRRFRMQGGYHLGATVVIKNSPGASVGTYGSAWCQSTLSINGAPQLVNNV